MYRALIESELARTRGQDEALNFLMTIAFIFSP